METAFPSISFEFHILYLLSIWSSCDYDTVTTEAQVSSGLHSVGPQQCAGSQCVRAAGQQDMGCSTLWGL